LENRIAKSAVVEVSRFEAIIFYLGGGIIAYEAFNLNIHPQPIPRFVLFSPEL